MITCDVAVPCRTLGSAPALGDLRPLDLLVCPPPLANSWLRPCAQLYSEDSRERALTSGLPEIVKQSMPSATLAMAKANVHVVNF